jgi:hypothetical protein
MSPQIGNTEDLDRLEALAKAATPGPWRVSEDDLTHPGSGCDIDADGGRVASDCCGYQGGITNMDDGEYIAAASPDVTLELIATIRSLRYTRERVESLVDNAEKFDSMDPFNIMRIRQAIEGGDI